MAEVELDTEFEDDDWQYMHLEQVSPEYMDVLWSDGWRHFGSFFFRQKLGHHEGSFTSIIPLRINLNKFKLSKSQNRVLRKSNQSKVIFREAFIDTQKEEIFFKHITRFKENIPSSIYDFVDKDTANVPCQTMECCLYWEDILYAVSFFDVGKWSNSSIYAMFDPAFSQMSPGMHTLLEEIRFAQRFNKDYLYTGYAYRETSHYDYKKKFSSTEAYDWQGKWRNLELVLK